MAQSYDMLGGWRVALDAIKADFKAAADAVVTENPQALKKAIVGSPSTFGGKYPYWVLYRITSSGQAESAERLMPAQVSLQVLVVDLATTQLSNLRQSGEGRAEESTLNGFAAWIDKLSDQDVVATRASGVEVSSTAAGAYDEYTRPMFRDREDNILWAHSADVVVTL